MSWKLTWRHLFFSEMHSAGTVVESPMWNTNIYNIQILVLFFYYRKKTNRAVYTIMKFLDRHRSFPRPLREELSQVSCSIRPIYSSSSKTRCRCQEVLKLFNKFKSTDSWQSWDHDEKSNWQHGNFLALRQRFFLINSGAFWPEILEHNSNPLILTFARDSCTQHKPVYLDICLRFLHTPQPVYLDLCRRFLHTTATNLSWFLPEILANDINPFILTFVGDSFIRTQTVYLDLCRRFLHTS